VIEWKFHSLLELGVSLFVCAVRKRVRNTLHVFYIFLSAIPRAIKLNVLGKTLIEFVSQYPRKWKTTSFRFLLWKSENLLQSQNKEIEFISFSPKRKREFHNAVSDSLTSFNIESAVVKFLWRTLLPGCVSLHVSLQMLFCKLVNIWKIIYLNCRERYEDMIDHHSYIHNLLLQLYTQLKQLYFSCLHLSMWMLWENIVSH